MSLYDVDDKAFQPFCGDTEHYANWKTMTDDRFNAAHGSFADFVRQYVPSSTPQEKSAVEGAQHAFELARGVLDPRDKCQLLVEGLNQLTADFPPTKTLRFVDVHTAQLRFPPEERMDEHPESIPLAKPDIVASLPGADRISSDPWRGISLAISVRADLSPDPLTSTHPEAMRARTRLMRFAGHHLASQNALCSFVLSVCGPMVQVYRFDHAACIVSPAFNYTVEPDILRMFFWSFVHPWNNTEFVGLDEYCTKASWDDLQWARKVAHRDWNAEDMNRNRWVKLPSTDPGKPDLELLTLRRRAGTDRVWSGATCVWEAIQRDDESGTRYIIKDTWQAVSSCPEKLFYERIMQNDMDLRHPPFGIAGFVRSVNYGALAARGETTLHRTASASLRRMRHAWRGERTHVRLLMDTVGTDLADVERSRDFVKAIRDAILGHFIAYKAGILHCDISHGNVMRAHGKPFKGFLHDFDMGAWIDSSAIGGTALPINMKEISDKQRKICRGTLKFLAVEIIESRRRPIARRATHDLQAFYWMVLLHILSYTPTKFKDVDGAVHALFEESEWDLLAEHKRKWFTLPSTEGFSYIKPLAYLMDSLRELVAKSIHSPSNPDPVDLEHASFLGVFDKALAMRGWPAHDWWRRTRDEGTHTAAAAAQPSPRAKSWSPHRQEGRDGGQHVDEPAGGPSTAHKRIYEADDDDCKERPRKKHKGGESMEHSVGADPQRHPGVHSRHLPQRAIDNAAGGVIKTPRPRRLISRVTRSRICGFWRYLLRR
ncbi:hypothetical protein DAEQUDRAFT_767732 [Daedalea quercina L-15889]|uniref:Fungal-type protein kinase domain-containing protein n=1 Tax=Daedalea quercina L-15889 TaxID=1314783 RepID=A0A165NBE9_9APHY|nr:hypothetical protein DAEQUDRAFT_767732 [Daedalea quercina L-15889]